MKKLLIAFICGFAVVANPIGIQQMLSLRVPAAVAGGAPGTPALELDASTISGSDNDPIGTWTATTGPNATAAGGVRPTLQTAEKNGLNVLRFDNADDLMTTTTVGTLTQPCTVFMVIKSTGANTVNRYAFTGSSTADNAARIYNYAVSQGFTIYAGGVDDYFTEDNDTNWHIIGVKLNGASSSYRVDGGSEGPLAVMNNIGTDGITTTCIGNYRDGSLPWDGDIAHVLVYSGAESMAAVFTYLNAKWAVY